MCRCVGVDVHPCVAARRRLDALVAVGEGGGGGHKTLRVGKNVSSK